MEKTTVPIHEVVFEKEIYPRSEWKQETVNRYADAVESGSEFPPIVLERKTNRLLDGMHRLQAHKQALKSEIACVWADVPDGVPIKVFAASLSAKHGDRISYGDLKQIARDTLEGTPSYDIKSLATMFSVNRKTVSNWVKDIVDRHITVRQLRAQILSRAGWSQTDIAQLLGVSDMQISRDVQADIMLIEDHLPEATAGLPESIDVDKIVEDIREERIFSLWSDEERNLLSQLRSGATIVVSLREGKHNNLIKWAEASGLYVRVDRRTPWGNPFEMPEDGNRQTVIKNYEDHYLPYKPSLQNKYPHLKGKALGCWCYPEPCHADVLVRAAEQQ